MSKLTGSQLIESVANSYRINVAACREANDMLTKENAELRAKLAAIPAQAQTDAAAAEIEKYRGLNQTAKTLAIAALTAAAEVKEKEAMRDMGPNWTPSNPSIQKIFKDNGLTAAAEAGEQTDLDANRLYRYLNGLDQDSHDSRAEHIMQQSLDGLTIGPNNRDSTKEILANHFEAIEAATIERCAHWLTEEAKALRSQVSGGDGSESQWIGARALDRATAAIRTLKEQT